MRLSAAQIRPVKGDIQRNIETHLNLAQEAVWCGADLIVFPELSITGYEPELAPRLAADQADQRFDVFQTLSDSQKLTIGIGAPTREDAGICISMIIFQPQKPRITYRKQHLHTTETAFFVNGRNSGVLLGQNADIAPAICYELSVPEHAESASKRGASVYMVGVVEDVAGVDRAIQKLSGAARKHSMTVLMANCVGRTGVYDCGGKSSIWDNTGELVAQLDPSSEGIVMFDTSTREAIQKTL